MHANVKRESSNFFTKPGWKIEGDVPRNISKYIIIVAPHSSNWDFLVGLAVRSINQFQCNFLGKKELFAPPFGWLFKKLGGRAVDRSKSENLVEQVAEIFKSETSFVLAIAPEGTRKKVERWKTGFYHIAFRAGIPIVMAGIDYPSKTVSFAPPLFPTGNLLEDAKIMESFFRDKRGKNRGVCPVL